LQYSPKLDDSFSLTADKGHLCLICSIYWPNNA